MIVFEILIALLGTCGLIVHSHILEGTPRKGMFRYYTNLSNLWTTLYFLFRVVIRVRGSYDGFFGRILFTEEALFIVMMSIFLTFAIYHFVLAPSFTKMPPDSSEFKFSHSFSNYLVHYIVPLLTLLTWVIFCDKTALRYRWGLEWTALPLLYLVFAYLKALDGKNIENSDSPYPYAFMDPRVNGWGGALRNCALVFAIFLAIGFALIFLRKLI